MEDSKKLVCKDTGVNTKIKKSVGLIFNEEGKLSRDSFRKALQLSCMHSLKRETVIKWLSVHRCE